MIQAAEKMYETFSELLLNQKRFALSIRILNGMKTCCLPNHSQIIFNYNSFLVTMCSVLVSASVNTNDIIKAYLSLIRLMLIQWMDKNMYSEYEHPVQLIAQYNDSAINQAGILKHFRSKTYITLALTTHTSHIECELKKNKKRKKENICGETLYLSKSHIYIDILPEDYKQMVEWKNFGERKEKIWKNLIYFILNTCYAQ